MSTVWNIILDKINKPEIPNKEINLSENYTKNIIPISDLTLKEFSTRNLAIPIYSKILDEEIWFCSNENMVEKIKGDNPEAVCYTADELLEIIKLDLTKERLKKFHEVKKTFRGQILKVNKN